MKIFKKVNIMKKLIIIISYLSLLSCSLREEPDYGKNKTLWVVNEIKIQKNKTAVYLAVTHDTTALNISNTWFLDSINAYRVGDTLEFCAKRNKNK